MSTLLNGSDGRSLESEKRRAALMKLGLAAAIAYTAPIIIRLDSANAGNCVPGGGGAHDANDPSKPCK
ncbi:MAG: hypothetical protein IIA72_11370 [Proteobacteria bacterium]|nr:hypothetical protein [Pseudomonadota bacterium]